MYRLIFLLLFSIPIHGMHIEIELISSADGATHRKCTSGDTISELIIIGENDLARRSIKNSENPGIYEYFGQAYNNEKKKIEELDEVAAELYFHSLMAKYRRLQQNSK